jgi:hypothetical protein
LDALGDRRLNELAGEYRAYRLDTRRFYPSADGPAAGSVLTARFDGSGKSLRLLFDTGAKGLYVAARTARSLRLEDLGPSEAAGADAAVTPGRVTLAAAVRFGAELEMGNVIVEALDMPFPDGIDGVVGAALFQKFQIRVSDRNQRIDLEPMQDGRQLCKATAAETCSPTFRTGHLLLLRAQAGYFVLDTGSAFHVLNAREQDGPPVRLVGAGGAVQGARRAKPVPLQLGGRTHFSQSWVAMDLTRMSNVEGIEIAGIAGYPLVRDSELIINYRDGWIRLAE